MQTDPFLFLHASSLFSSMAIAHTYPRCSWKQNSSLIYSRISFYPLLALYLSKTQMFKALYSNMLQWYFACLLKANVCKNHRIIQIGRNTWRSSSPTLCSGPVTSNCSGPCLIELWISLDGVFTASKSLFLWLGMPMVEKKISLCIIWISCVAIGVFCLSFCPCAPPRVSGPVFSKPSHQL